MNYTINDIQIFVPTYNRPEMIKETLNSLLNQTVKGLDITFCR
ncbi:MAG: glycosyltransferase [Elusimicrobiota bacterium]|jgi:glycosyltransferase involved in cell wall biosynthesis|nr:glycosyltransferase [Elusimicrobiota bacterium]